MQNRSFSIQQKIWNRLIKYSKRRFWLPFIYKSYWHYLFHSKRKKKSIVTLYYTARPNPHPVAGIGHQMANWNQSYWYAKRFGLHFAYYPFPSEAWDDFLGLGVGEKTVEELLQEGYKLRKLPWFEERNENEVQLQRKIIASYAGSKVVFIAEQDQSYREQYGVMEDLQRKFYASPSRQNDHLIYSKDHFNIAIHARRGDIMTDLNNPNMAKRYLSNDFFYNVLTQVMDVIDTNKEVHIYFFSQGSPDDFPEFKSFKNLHWCFDMSAQQSFLHMVYADLLITSKSSFSYKPALLNKGIKVCPKNFWHSYPNTEDWILCDNEGNIISDIDAQNDDKQGAIS